MSAPETTILRWLHLTDLHVGYDKESQKTALQSLIVSIEQFSDGKGFDLVLLTGDLAFSGQPKEYDALKSLLIDPLRSKPLCARAKFIATPGNHDMDCAIEYPPTWKGLGRSRQETFFNLGEDGQTTRGTRAQAFSAYRDFVTETGILSVDPTKKPACVFEIDGTPRKIAFLSAVTAFFSDKEISDRHDTPAPVHPIRTLLGRLPEGTQPIILGHHPPDWFTQDSAEHLHSLLIEKNALYLHGHQHRVKPKFGSRGLACLGFGAAYQAPAEKPPIPYYRNSFAICELADSLHVSVVSWDSEHGQWRPEQQLPGDFSERSGQLKDGYLLPLPTTLLNHRQGWGPIAAAIREKIHIDKFLWLVEDGATRWVQLLSTLGLLRNVTEKYGLASQAVPAGHSQFRTRDNQGRQYLVYAVAGHGDILHLDHIQAINTELDQQDYTACIIATLGSFSADARTLAVRLASRKEFQIIEREELLRRLISNLHDHMKREVWNAIDPNSVVCCLVITENGFALLIQEKTRNDWFQLIAQDGTILAESSPIVLAVRKEQSALRQARYEGTVGGSGISPVPAPSQTFDRDEYLRKGYEYFDNVKYAPLAALGFRFRRTSLSEIYVEASADIGDSSRGAQLTRAVSEFVESLSLPKTQQQQLESQLRSQYGLSRSAEVGAARKLYQRYNSVVVVGDPGSGKTCFIQHEILAYCLPSNVKESWYSNHLPIYVPLAEAARLLNDDNSLLDLTALLSAHRGIDLPRSVIEDAISDGRAAFFFDGLDEVGYIDKRIALMSEIDSLVRNSAHRGNRFVLASRPAALQPVDIPEAFTFLQLKGLTEQEIRTLGERVLTARLKDDEDGKLTPDEAELINRLLDDTRSNPGIARLARNPLLLTLLVLIYANTGALSAKRHLIYTQAIKTLVSVRGRQTREQQISEADLRTRLGKLALSIFQKEVAEIPGRPEVIELLAPLMSPRADRSAPEAADSFIQEVAEATGLLAVHSKGEDGSEDLVTFMHYSFLEYYAAAGLLAQEYVETVPRIASNPRWRDVTTLLFGMLSEQGDITELLERLLSDDSPSEAVSSYKIVLALDCANECDVPPEQSQELLAGAILETVAHGVGRYAADLRSHIAARLEPLIQGTSWSMKTALADGLTSEDPVAAAAFTDLIARVGQEVILPVELISAFESCLDHQIPVVRVAAMHAIERRPELRTEKAMGTLRKMLRGNLVEKHAALKVVGILPFDVSLRELTTDLLDDPNPLISSAAARCLLIDTLRENQTGGTSSLIEKVLLRLRQDISQETGFSIPDVTLDKVMIRSLVFSDDAKQSELAIRHIPLIRDDDSFVHELLMRRLRTATTPAQKSACIDSLRESPRAIGLITIADTDILCAQLSDSNRNVRIAAVRLMGEMPSDEQIVAALQKHLDDSATRASREQELTETAKALAKHIRRNSQIRSSVLQSVLDKLPQRVEDGYGDAVQQQHIVALLSVCESIDGITNETAAWKLYRVAENFRTPIHIRQRATRVFGRLVEPSAKAMETFIRLLERSDPRLNDARYAAAVFFVFQCRRRVEYVRRVYTKLNQFQKALYRSWEREFSQTPQSINPHGLANIREAIIEVSNLMIAYGEFSARAKIS